NFQVGGIVAEQLGARGLATQPLLQIVEASDVTIEGYEQLSIQNSIEAYFGEQIRKGRAYVLAIPAEQSALAVASDKLSANAVPLPFGDKALKIQLLQLCLFNRVRQHEGTKRSALVHGWRIAAPFQPGEQIKIGGLQPMPELFDGRYFLITECCDRGLGEAFRNADPQAAGNELQQRPAPCRIKAVQPRFQQARHLTSACALQQIGNLCQAWFMIDARLRWPNQCDSFRQVANVVVRPAEKDGIDPRFCQGPDNCRLCSGKTKLTGQSCQGPPSVRVFGVGKIILDQAQLDAAPRGENQAVKQLGEGLQTTSSCSSSPRPIRESARPRIPRKRHQWIRASSLPWVTQTSGA